MGWMDFFFLKADALIRNPPAHAGNTLRNPRPCADAWNHPRLRGEYVNLSEALRVPQGSPPLTRGILMLAIHNLPGCGITPAYAGNTCSPQKTSNPSGDHPRLRGEYPNTSLTRPDTKGSPPLTRGIPIEGYEVEHGERITPAYAGNTCGTCYVCDCR